MRLAKLCRHPCADAGSGFPSARTYPAGTYLRVPATYADAHVHVHMHVHVHVHATWTCCVWHVHVHVRAIRCGPRGREERRRPRTPVAVGDGRVCQGDGRVERLISCNLGSSRGPDLATDSRAQRGAPASAPCRRPVDSRSGEMAGGAGAAAAARSTDTIIISRDPYLGHISEDAA